MFYIHHTTCISPQHSFPDIDLEKVTNAVDNLLKVIEPSYTSIPRNTLRRMGKAVRIAVGAAIPLVERTNPDGFIIGTADGGMEDCIKFLNQIIEYDEGVLTPGNFVQSTPNAIASQVAFLTSNRGYNITHVQRGLAFENAVIDAAMQLKEQPAKTFLVGGVDEISAYNYNIDILSGWYRKDTFPTDFYAPAIPGSTAGEGAAMFTVNNSHTNAVAHLKAIATKHTYVSEELTNTLNNFLQQHLPLGEQLDLLLSGENGDCRLLDFYTRVEEECKPRAVARYKHLCGEYPTSSGFALWLACQVLQKGEVLPSLLKTPAAIGSLRNILIYNNYKGYQHSFMLVSVAD